MSTLGGYAAGAAGGIIATAINNYNQRKMARESMQWQQQENERAFQRDIQMWNMQNQYNSPEAQRKRLEDAGMNPQLAFGNGIQGSVGNADGSPKYNPAQAITPDLQPYNLGTGSDVSNIVQQRLLLQQQKKFQDAQIGEINARTLKKLQELKLDKETFQYTVDAARENARQLELMNTNLSFRNSIQSEQWELDKQLKQMDISYKSLQNEISQFNLDFERDARDIRMSALQLQNVLTRSHIYLSQNQQNYLISLTAKTRKEAAKIETDTELQKVILEYQSDLQAQRKSNFSYMTDQEFTSFVSQNVKYLVDDLLSLIPTRGISQAIGNIGRTPIGFK